MREKYSFNLAKFRKRMKPRMSQQQLAKLVGVHRSSIASYESGLFYPNVEIQKKISDVLHVQAHKIFPIN